MKEGRISGGIAEALSRYRAIHKLTQGQVAEKLEITQAHVSRIEKGDLPSEHLRTRILTLLSGQGLPDFYNFEVNHQIFKNWEIAYMSHPAPICGDRVYFHPYLNQNKIYLMHCDAVGSDAVASRDADNLILSFEASINALGFNLNNYSLYDALNRTVRGGGKSNWRDKPSAFFVSLYEGASRVEFTNAGMPNPLIFKFEDMKCLEHSSVRWPAVGNKKKQDSYVSDILELAKGDVLFLFSDGFYSNFNKYADVEMKKQLLSLISLHRSNVKSILSRLMKNFSQNLTYRELTDDISCLMIRKVL